MLTIEVLRPPTPYLFFPAMLLLKWIYKRWNATSAKRVRNFAKSWQASISPDSLPPSQLPPPLPSLKPRHSLVLQQSWHFFPLRPPQRLPQMQFLWCYPPALYYAPLPFNSHHPIPMFNDSQLLVARLSLDHFPRQPRFMNARNNSLSTIGDHNTFRPPTMLPSSVAPVPRLIAPLVLLFLSVSSSSRNIGSKPRQSLPTYKSDYSPPPPITAFPTAPP